MIAGYDKCMTAVWEDRTPHGKVLRMGDLLCTPI